MKVSYVSRTWLSPVKRRSILPILGCGTLWLAGCTNRQTSEVGLASVLIANGRNTAIDVNITIDRKGKTRYRKTHTLPPQSTDDNAIEIKRDWMGQRVPYSTTVEIVGSTKKQTYSSSEAQKDFSGLDESSCFDVSFVIEPSRIRVAVGKEDSC